MPEMNDLRATDALFDALGAGVAVDTDDEVVAALAALAEFAREGAGVRSHRAVELGDTSPVDRRLAIRSLAAGVAAVAVVCTGGISAAVTGNPLHPVEIVIEQMIPDRSEKATPPSTGQTDSAPDVSHMFGTRMLDKIDLARIKLLGQPPRAELLRPTPGALDDPAESSIADVDVAEDLSELPAEEASVTIDAESDGSAPVPGGDVDGAQEGAQPADADPLSAPGPVAPTAAADKPAKPDKATGRPTGTDDAVDDGEAVQEGDDGTDDDVVEDDGTTAPSRPTAASAPAVPDVRSEPVRRSDRPDDTERDDGASAEVSRSSAAERERVARAAQVLAGLLIGRR